MVIKLSPFGSAASVALTSEEVWCQTGKHTGSTGFAVLLCHAHSRDKAVPELSSALLLLSAKPKQETGVGA